MLATASPSRKRSLDTHFRRSWRSACMNPMIGGARYDVGASWKSVVTISFGSPAPVASNIRVAMAALLVGGESSRAPAFGILTFLSGTWKDHPEQRALPSRALQFDPASAR